MRRQRSHRGAELARFHRARELGRQDMFSAAKIERDSNGQIIAQIYRSGSQVLRAPRTP